MKLVHISAIATLIVTSLVSTIAPVQALTTVSPDSNGYTVSHDFNISGCTPAPIELTSAVSARIPTDSLVNSSQIAITIPVSVRETASDCNIDRGVTVQLENLSSVPSYLQINHTLSDTVSEGVIAGNIVTSGELVLVFDVVGIVPHSQAFGINLDVAAYSILDEVNLTVTAPDSTIDTNYQATIGSPVAPTVTPIAGNSVLF